MEFSRNLRRLRLAKKLTQEQAATVLGVSAQSISRWECGTTLPDITMLPAIARLYCVTIDDLYKESSVAYANYAERLGSVFEASRKPEDFLQADIEYRKLLESGKYTMDDLRMYGILHQYMMQISRDKALADVQKSFHKFAELATFGVIANGDDEHTLQAMEGIDYISFGLGDHNRIHAANMCPDWRHFDVICDGEFYCHLDMGVLGKHNALNGLAAAAAAWMMGIPGEAVSHGLESFHGAGRRMEFKGTYKSADVYDDYAHHPDELAATIDAVRASMPGRRLVLAFQPHTYSRTNALFDDFVRQLQKADVCVLAEIYAARERNLIGISSAHLAQKIPGAVFCETLPEVTAYLREHVREGDVVITMGAGDIFRAGEALLSE